MHIPIAVLLLVLAAASRVSSQGTPAAWLILCAANDNAVPFGLTTGKLLTSNVCAALNAGRDPLLSDVANAVPAALPCMSYSSGMSVDVSTSSASAGSGAGRAAKATIATFVADLTAGSTLPPEVIVALAQGTVYPNVYILSSKYSTALPKSGFLTSAWALRNVLLSGVESDWSVDNGPQHTLKFVASAASYRVYTQAVTGAISKYPNVGCYNADRNSFSLSTDTC